MARLSRKSHAIELTLFLCTDLGQIVSFLWHMPDDATEGVA